MTPNARFTELLQDIEPSPSTVADAVSAHQTMRDFLCYHDNFTDRHVRTFLSGSYKRDTAIRPRRQNGVLTRPDVDIIVVTNHVLDDCPKEVVDELYDAISDGYSNIQKQTRSVGVITPKVDMDVVPIIEPYGEGGRLYIPDRELVKWLSTNPPEHTAWTTRINNEAEGRFKPLVKLLKWWRRHNEELLTGRHPKGFIIECIAAECMDYTEKHYGELFTKTLENIVSRYAVWMTRGIVPFIADPGVPGNLVTTNVSYEDFRSFYDLAKAHAAIARQALAEEDTEEMTKQWREIFGPRFPSTTTIKAENSLLSVPITGVPLFFPDRPVQPKKPAGFA